MSYYKLKDNDLFINTLEAYPDVKFYIQSVSIYIDDEAYISGTTSDNILGVPRNYTSLYEYNINRSGSYLDVLDDPNPVIYPYVIKNGSKSSFKNITDETYNTAYSVGDEIPSTYNLSASITRYYITGSNVSTASFGPDSFPITGTQNFYFRALKNTINYYKYLSPHYDYDMINTGSAVNMITIPSIFYGSRIRKGSVNLKYYITGTLAAQASDYRYNGELVQVSGTTTGSVVGVVLYKEGFVLLSSSLPIDGNNIEYEQVSQSAWTRFGYGANDGKGLGQNHLLTSSASPLSASYVLEFQGTNKVQTMTMLCKAPEGELNHSNNPTYLKNSTKSWEANSSGSVSYVERTRHIKNIVSASYNDIEPPMQKETYISKIALYDKDRNVIGYAKLATPVRKTEAREFIFKLKLDL